MPGRSRGRVLLGYFWAAPWTLLGLLLGVTALATGGASRRRGGIIEFFGGSAAWILRHMPGMTGGARAMTLGHVVLGCTTADLDFCRTHELVHVRQYERWGLFFVPAYLVSSLVLWLRGKDAYRDNPFERQAYDESSPDERY